MSENLIELTMTDEFIFTGKFSRYSSLWSHKTLHTGNEKGIYNNRTSIVDVL